MVARMPGNSLHGGACLMQLLQQLAHARAQEQAQPHGEVLHGGRHTCMRQEWDMAPAME